MFVILIPQYNKSKAIEVLLKKCGSLNLQGKTQFTINSLCIDSNKIHFSNCKSVVSNPKCFLVASDNLYGHNDKNAMTKEDSKGSTQLQECANNKHVHRNPYITDCKLCKTELKKHEYITS
jgi:hypothetical protein